MVKVVPAKLPPGVKQLHSLKLVLQLPLLLECLLVPWVLLQQLLKFLLLFFILHIEQEIDLVHEENHQNRGPLRLTQV